VKGTTVLNKEEEEEEIYICSSRLGLIKMDHHHFGNGRIKTKQGSPGPTHWRRRMWCKHAYFGVE
jgi:hypothetical protein